MDTQMPLISELSTEKCPNLSSMAALSWSEAASTHLTKALDSLAVPQMANSPSSVPDDDARVPAMSDLGQEDRSLISPDNYAVPQQEPELLFDTASRETRVSDLSSSAERLVPSLSSTPVAVDRAIVADVAASSRCSPVAAAGVSADSPVPISTSRRFRFAPAVRAPARSAHGINFAITMTNRPQATPTSRNYLHINYDSEDDERSQSQSANRASGKRRARAQHRAAANKSLDWSESDADASLDEFASEQSQPSTKKAHVSPTNRARKHKQCACCNTTSTPLWRDVRPNLPLCNACGIRFKKYGKICDSCHYVPCKSERDSKLCNRCGDKLPPASKPKMVRK